jgi:hypothetical protein
MNTTATTTATMTGAPQVVYVTQPTSGMAIGAIWCALLGLCFLPLMWVGMGLGIAALNEIGRSNGALHGRGQALTGVLIGGIWTSIIVNFIVYVIWYAVVMSIIGSIIHH